MIFDPEMVTKHDDVLRMVAKHSRVMPDGGIEFKSPDGSLISLVFMTDLGIVGSKDNPGSFDTAEMNRVGFANFSRDGAEYLPARSEHFTLSGEFTKPLLPLLAERGLVVPPELLVDKPTDAPMGLPAKEINK